MSLKETALFLNGITLGEFENIIAAAVKKELEPHLQKLSEAQPDKGEELLSKKQAADFLRISLPTLSKLIRLGVVQCCRIGGSLRFKKSQLEKTVERSQSRKFHPSIVNSC